MSISLTFSYSPGGILSALFFSNSLTVTITSYARTGSPLIIPKTCVPSISTGATKSVGNDEVAG